MNLVIQRRKVKTGYRWLLVDKDTDTILPGQHNIRITEANMPGSQKVTVEFNVIDGLQNNDCRTGIYFDVHPSAQPCGLKKDGL